MGLKLPTASGKTRPLYATLFAGIVVLVVSISTMNASADVGELKDRHETLSSDLAGLDREILEKQAAVDATQKEAVVEATGLDPSLIATDTTSAEAYFGPAFNWKSGAEYDQVRSDYEAALGAKNTFTKTYFPENIKIDTNDGDLSFIDHKKLKSTMQDLVIVPTSGEGNRIRYVAFVTYTMYTDEKDLGNIEALTPSTAIIEFTAAGESSDRTVSEVSAWAGFSAALEN